MDPCGTLQEVRKFAFNIYKKYLFRKIWFKPFIVLSENLIALSFCNKISWSIMSNSFCRSINIIPVNKPSSNPFETLSVKKDKHRFVE